MKVSAELVQIHDRLLALSSYPDSYPMGTMLMHLRELQRDLSAVVTAQPDMTDWHNWEEGDVLERVVARGTNYFVGQICILQYTLKSGYIGVKDDYAQLWAADFKWRSRPEPA